MKFNTWSSAIIISNTGFDSILKMTYYMYNYVFRHSSIQPWQYINVSFFSSSYLSVLHYILKNNYVSCMNNISTNYLISLSNIVKLYWNVINNISLVRECFGPRAFLRYFFSWRRPSGLFPASIYYNEAQQNYWKYFMNDWFSSKKLSLCIKIPFVKPWY